MPPKQGLYDPQFEHDACGVGFVVNIKGKKSHQIVRDALTVLINLNHRGACGCEANTGDGAGILMQMPHEFFQQVCDAEKIALPAPGHYGSGMVFMPRAEGARRKCERAFERIVKEEGQTFLGWRHVPTNNAALGKTARSSEPSMRQIFIGRSPDIADDMVFERKLYIIRKRAEKEIRYTDGAGKGVFYISSLSFKTFVYKGMLLTEQMDDYYPELKDPALKSALALVHSRFSTNTFPSWDRAHPYRYIAHNGEINALRGNINWMHARQAIFQSGQFGEDIKKLLPIINTDGSDSAMFDNCLELLVLAGRSLPHAVMMMIPEPWTNHETMSDEKKAFYEYHSCLMEPWDGPASIAFSDGKKIGAVLDRNGLRPSRYYVTKDDMVVMASEVGVLDIEPERVLEKGRLQPGRMFLIDTEEGRIVADEEIKSKISGIQASTGSAIGDIEKIAAVIQQVDEIVATIAAAIEEQSTVTKDVASNIAQASTGVKDSNERVAQTATVSQSIAKEISSINVTVGEVRTGGEEIQASATALSKLAEQLKTLVAQFKV